MPHRIHYYDSKHLESLPQLQKISNAERLAMKAVAQVLPFRSNNYVVEQLIDWQTVSDDPIFRLTFPHPNMLPCSDLQRVTQLLERNASKEALQSVANEIRHRLIPHLAGQKTHNIPYLDLDPVPGLQHKYR